MTYINNLEPFMNAIVGNSTPSPQPQNIPNKGNAPAGFSGIRQQVPQQIVPPVQNFLNSGHNAMPMSAMPMSAMPMAGLAGSMPSLGGYNNAHHFGSDMSGGMGGIMPQQGIFNNNQSNDLLNKFSVPNMQDTGMGMGGGMGMGMGGGMGMGRGGGMGMGMGGIGDILSLSLLGSLF